MSDPMPPRRLILILGQKKAGTTSLYALVQSTGLPLVEVTKESGVLHAPAILEKTLAKSAPGAVLLDATTTYFETGAFSEGFKASLALFDQVTVLFCCRPEKDRLPSHFRHSSNHDGWEGTLEDFVAADQYLNHARLAPTVAAVEALGLTDIHVVPFAYLNDPDRSTAFLEPVLGARPRPDQTESQNTFGDLLVMPNGLRRFMAGPLFQVVIRPLVPQGLRAWLKARVGKAPQDVTGVAYDAPAVRAVWEQVDRENAAVLARFGPGAARAPKAARLEPQP